MNLFDLLEPGAVRVLSTASSKKRLLCSISEIGHACYGFDQSKAVEALMDRENLGPTGVGNGVALPHARLQDIDRVRGVFVLLEKPVEFRAVDHLPADIFFALFAPENAGVEHLKALAAVSRTLRDGSICAKLRANPNASTLYTILTEAQRTQAA
jgi:PTS system nitrogen regulatory IIA component